MSRWIGAALVVAFLILVVALTASGWLRWGWGSQQKPVQRPVVEYREPVT